MLLGLAALTRAASPPEAGEDAATLPSVGTVLVFDQSASDPVEVAGALSTATRVFTAARLTLNWIDCSAGTGPVAPSPCGRTPEPNEFVVRIVPESARIAAGISPLVLGFATLDESGRGVMATVYAGATRRLAREAGMDTARLMGRVIAHEIGHLLLGTGRHALRGLMRAGWNASDVRRSRDAEWRFSSRERERILRRLPASTSASP